MFKIKYAIFFISLFSGLLFSTYVSASSPIVIEFFGKNSCGSDTAIQETLQKIVKTQDNIHIINCRTRNDGTKEAKTFTLQFCTNRRKLYDKKFGKAAFRSPAFIIVNGRWDANYADLEPAIKLGRHDDVKSISVSVRDNIIDISLPEIESDKKFGDILLYAYVPTMDETAVFVDSDVSLTDKMKEKINKNKSVPFVTKARTSPFYFRPILATERIGLWNGEAMNLTFSLNDITSLSGSSYADLSYVVVLHEGGEVGNILAVGEYISLKEFNNTLPHSKPVDIMLISPAPKDQVQ